MTANKWYQSVDTMRRERVYEILRQNRVIDEDTKAVLANHFRTTVATVERDILTYRATFERVALERIIRTKLSQQRSRAKRHGALDDLTFEELMTIIDATNGRCSYCGVEVEKQFLTIDHIIPLSCGGDNTVDNIAAVCKDCNRRKSFRVSLIRGVMESSDKYHVLQMTEEDTVRIESICAILGIAVTALNAKSKAVSFALLFVTTHHEEATKWQEQNTSLPSDATSVGSDK